MPSLAASSPAAETRVARHKVFLPAEMIGATGTVRIHLLNLSVTGALAYAERTPRPDAVIQMRCGDATWLARVVWTQDKKFGLVHVVPLAPSAVAKLVSG